MKTFSAKPEEVRRDWFVVDATDKILGRLATELASRLRGKHKAVFTPHVDTGDTLLSLTLPVSALPAIKWRTRFTTTIPGISAI
jgi:hypothetical protein